MLIKKETMEYFKLERRRFYEKNKDVLEKTTDVNLDARADDMNNSVPAPIPSSLKRRWREVKAEVSAKIRGGKNQEAVDLLNSFKKECKKVSRRCNSRSLILTLSAL